MRPGQSDPCHHIVKRSAYLPEHCFIKAEQIHLVDCKSHMPQTQQSDDRGVPLGLGQQSGGCDVTVDPRGVDQDHSDI